MKQMTGYIPFGARRTMTQKEEDESDLEKDKRKDLEEMLRSIIRTLVLERLNQNKDI